jgi:hypothetical protein
LYVLKITELLESPPTPLWRIVKQAGVDEVVSLFDGVEQQWRWPKTGAQHLVPGRYVAPPKGERPIGYITGLREAVAKADGGRPRARGQS